MPKEPKKLHPMRELNTNMKCLVPYCPREVYTRGNCKSHREMLRKLIDKGIHTEEELVKSGKMLPNKRQKFSDWLKQEGGTNV